MRHSDIGLTMNVYTDPRLLDVAGAMGALPDLSIGEYSTVQRQAGRATGTDGQSADEPPRNVAVNVAVNSDDSCNLQTIPANLASDDVLVEPRKNPGKTSVFPGFIERGRRGSNPQPPDRQSDLQLF